MLCRRVVVKLVRAYMNTLKNRKIIQSYQKNVSQTFHIFEIFFKFIFFSCNQLESISSNTSISIFSNLHEAECELPTATKRIAPPTRMSNFRNEDHLLNEECFS